jgi:arylsulfatase A-like enzyme
LIVIVALAACEREPAQVRDRPPREGYNVLLISADTVRADRLNCYGYQDHEVSPNLDALARDGILFENHIAASPWTTPSHVSLITSQHPSTHGITQSFVEVMDGLGRNTFNRLPDARLTLAEVFRENGYETAAFTGGITLDPKIGFDQGFSTYGTSMYKLNDENMGELFGWLAAHAADNWFLFWHTFEAHAPYLHADFLPEEYAAIREDYDELAKTLAGGQAHVNNKAIVSQFLRRRHAYNRAVCEALYAGGIGATDRWVGRLVAQLRRLGLYDRTMIVFTSDHGEEFADHNPSMFYDRHGHTAFEEMIRIPLIIKLPHQQHAGTRIPWVSRAIDVMPTVLEHLSMKPARDEMQGDSLRPMWEEPSADDRRIAFSEAAAFRYEVKSARTQQYKYVILIGPRAVEEHGRSHIPETGTARMLFDLERDPGEQENLLGAGPHAPAAALAADLDALLRAVLSTQQAETDEVVLDEETIRRLKALGYIQ